MATVSGRGDVSVSSLKKTLGKAKYLHPKEDPNGPEEGGYDLHI